MSDFSVITGSWSIGSLESAKEEASVCRNPFAVSRRFAIRESDAFSNAGSLYGLVPIDAIPPGGADSRVVTGGANALKSPVVITSRCGLISGTLKLVGYWTANGSSIEYV